MTIFGRLAGLSILLFAGLSTPALAERAAIVSEDLTPELREELAGLLPDETVPETPFEARRQAERAADVLRAALNSRGYHDAKVDFAVEPGPPLKPLVRLRPGPQFTLDAVTVSYAETAPRVEDADAVADAHELSPGDAARAEPVLKGQRRIADALQELGYPDARPLSPEIRGDRDAATLSVNYVLNAGDRARFGTLKIENDGRTRDSYINKIDPIEPGSVYTPSTLAELNARLNETRLFRLATARLEPTGEIDPETGDVVRDVIVKLEERPRHTLRLGGSFSSSEGPSARAGWTRRNLTGRGDTLEAELEIGTLERDLILRWLRPNEFGYGYGLSFTGGVSDQTTDAFDRRAVFIGAALDITKNPRRIFRLGGNLELTQEEDAFGQRDLQIISLEGSARLDESNDPLDATHGWKADLALSPTYTLGDESTPYIRSVAQISAYLPALKNDRLVLAGRLRAGGVFGADTSVLPVSDRFFAGGGGSVRGYEFQGIGPRDAETNTPLGGRSLVDGSLEARYRVTTKIGVVAFVDGGSVSDDTTASFDDMRYGAGLGIRYDTQVGPIRFDIATPLDPRDGDDPIQIYLSIGQAF